MKICHVCMNTGNETYDSTNENGFLCTTSRACPRCAKTHHRREILWTVVAVLAIALPLGLVAWEGLR